MTRRLFLSLCGAAVPALVLMPVAAGAHGYKTGTIDITHPWTFEQDGKNVDAVIGMDLHNKARHADSLIKVEAPDAVSIELRSGSVPVKMIDIAAGARLTLSATGPHILLKGVRKTLFAYNNLYITLVFAKAGRIKVEVVVEDRPA